MLKEKTKTEIPESKWMETRLGFSPEKLVRVTGVTMGPQAAERQKVLERAKAYQGPTFAPPARLVRERSNPYDPGAVVVHVGYDALRDETDALVWTYGHVGYLPKGFEIRPGLPVWYVLDRIEKERTKEQLKVGVNFIVRSQGTKSFGCELGLLLVSR